MIQRAGIYVCLSTQQLRMRARALASLKPVVCPAACHRDVVVLWRCCCVCVCAMSRAEPAADRGELADGQAGPPQLAVRVQGLPLLLLQQLGRHFRLQLHTMSAEIALQSENHAKETSRRKRASGGRGGCSSHRRR